MCANRTICSSGSVSQCDSPAAGNPNKDDCAHLSQALIDEADAAPYILTSPAGVSRLACIEVNDHD